jgi:hypothetical protein
MAIGLPVILGIVLVLLVIGGLAYIGSLPEPNVSTTTVLRGSTSTTTPSVGGPLNATPSNLASFVSGQYASVDLFAAMGGGTPPYNCTLGSKSVLPAGLTVNGDCTISGTRVLSAGTTKESSPPFTVVVSDSSDPMVSVSYNLSVTTVLEKPTLVPVQGECTTDEFCDTQVAIATGGVPPYTFSSDSFSGATPIGLIVNMDGNLSGTPNSDGVYSFGICVSDSVGAEDCNQTSVNVNPAASTVYTTTVDNSQFSATLGSVSCTLYPESGGYGYTVSASGGAAGPVGSWIAGYVCDEENSWCNTPSVTTLSDDGILIYNLGCGQWANEDGECVRSSSSQSALASLWQASWIGNPSSGATMKFVLVGGIANAQDEAILAVKTAVCPPMPGSG